MAKVAYLGGSSRPDMVGSSCIVIDDDERIMIDCGIEPSGQDENEMGAAGTAPDFTYLLDGKKINAVILTHAHTDHCGALGLLATEGFLADDARIIGAPQTMQGLPYVLEDALKHGPSFTAYDIAGVINRCHQITQPGEFEIFPGRRAFVKHNGHVPGSVYVILELRSGRKGLISGDMSRQDRPTTKGWQLLSESVPSEWVPDDIWLIESTYRKGSVIPLEDEVQRLIARTSIGLNFGHVVIAGFGWGRIQDLAVWLSQAKIKVWIDGAAREVYRIFQKHHWCELDGVLPEPGSESGIFFVENEEHRRELLNSTEPKTFLTTSGMGSFGRIRSYEEELLPRKGASVFFSGYLSRRSIGGKLMRIKERREQLGERVNDEDFSIAMTGRNGERYDLPVRAEIDQFRLGAHSDFGDSLDFVEDIVEVCRSGEKLGWGVAGHGAYPALVDATSLLSPYTVRRAYGLRNTVLEV